MSQLTQPTGTPLLQPDRRNDQGLSCDIPCSRTPIYILDDDSLLNIFYHSRPVLIEDTEVDNDYVLEGGAWDRERWWYKLVQVCRRWRYLILRSASYLQLCLVCTYGTPLAEMLLHSPPFPLIIDHIDENHYITAEDEERVMLALRHRNRLRRIRLLMPLPNLQKFIVAVDDEFPILEFLYLEAQSRDLTQMSLTLPTTFRAPRLSHLVLHSFGFPIRSPLLTTPNGLVTLSLQRIHPSTSFRPNELLQRLSHMPQLETLGIAFRCYFPSSDIVRELSDMSTMTHATLPNLRWLGFGGPIAYLEAFLPRITTPLLEKFQLRFANEPTFSLPRLLQFMKTTKNLRMNAAQFYFDDSGIDVKVSSMAQIFDDLSPVFSTVEHLALTYAKDDLSPEEYNEADRSHWRKLLRPFRNVKALLVNNELVGEVVRCLRLEDGELPLELFPELKELSYSASDDAADGFRRFIDARRVAGHPVNLIRR
ncbi:hypothetical protein F5148DRAFT_1147619 [Russula earlei]|uniref:Uncharacterized protein n=1 Tax=Russula earlei TaxID=71964 RepID=A0ACC0UGA8_9AGAM|nr:hypothetical protein F5148DRAFT_1147619 [Russula earlei]